MIVSDEEYAQMREQLGTAAETCAFLADRVRSLEADLAYNEAQNAKLVEGVCLLGDTLLSSFRWVSMFEQTPETQAAAQPVKDVIQYADFLMAGHDHSTREWHSGTAVCADALRDALAHPVIAALLDAWATKEG
jgi:hypothetical protein